MAQWVNNISDWELLARTLQAEAGNQGPEGMIAVGSVIMNRAGGDPRKIRDVILKRGQFSAWNSLTGYAGGEQGQDMENMQPSDIAFTIAANLINDKYTDPTGGATHYYNPTISSPAWGQSKAGGDWQQIGDHLFGNADAKRSGESPKNPPEVRISTNNPTTETLSRVGSELNMQPKSPLLQSIMNESGYPNMGMPPIAGYSVPAQAPQTAPQQPTLPSGNNAPRGGFGRIMDFLGDAKKAQQLSATSRTDFGRRMNEMATARVNQGLSNRTVEYLRQQPDGEPFAREIEAGGNPAEVMAKYRDKDTASGSPETYGLTPQIIVGKDGTKKIMQIGNRGNIKITDLPEGFDLRTGGLKKVDMGTHWGFQDPQTGQILYRVDKNIAEQVIETKTAESTVKAKSAIDKARYDTGVAQNIIKRLRGYGENLGRVLGVIEGDIDPRSAQGKAYFRDLDLDIIKDIDALKGVIGTQAYQSLKGAGAITEKELTTAIEGLGNLTRLQSLASFLDELSKVETTFITYLQIAEDKAAADPSSASTTSQTQVEPVAPLNTEPTATPPVTPPVTAPTTQQEPNVIVIK